MSFIDLHVHSNASDGTYSPREVVQEAIAARLCAIALTDHDTISGIVEALDAACQTDLEVIPGIELSCMYSEHLSNPAADSKKLTEIHILGLFVNHNSKEFIKRLEHLVAVRNDRNEEILRRFSLDGIELSMEELLSGNPGTVITRAHFARALKDKGYVSSIDQAFKKYLSYDGPYCIRKELITPEYAMETLAAAGAFPIIAHPMLYHMGYGQLETMIAYLKNLGLAGVEAYHSSHNQHQSGLLKTMAQKYQLLLSGGSDFHGANKPDIRLGSGRGGLRLTHYLLDDIKKAHYNTTKGC